MKKKILIIVLAIFSFFVIAGGCLFGYYINSLGSVETNKDNIKYKHVNGYKHVI